MPAASARPGTDGWAVPHSGISAMTAANEVAELLPAGRVRGPRLRRSGAGSGRLQLADGAVRAADATRYRSVGVWGLGGRERAGADADDLVDWAGADGPDPGHPCPPRIRRARANVDRASVRDWALLAVM